MTPDRLEEVLASVGHHLELPERPDATQQGELPPSAPPRGVGGGRRRAAAIVAAAAVVALAVVLVDPSTRAAVADLLGIGTTRIEISVALPADAGRLPHVAHGLDPIADEEVAGILGQAPPDTSGTALGPPDVRYRMPEGGVLLAWNEAAATLWVRPMADGDVLVRKLLIAESRVEPVDDLGREAVIIDDSHVLETPNRRLAAGTVLLWYDDRWEYRLEAELPHGDLIGVGRAVG